MTLRRFRPGEAILLFSLVLVVGCTSGSSLVGVPNPTQGPAGGASGAGGAPSLPVTDAGLAEHAPQQLIIRFLPGASTQAVLKEINGTELGQLKTFNAVVVGLPQGASIVDAIRRVQAMSGVKYAEPNYIYRAFLTPNDPFFATKQWGPQKINAPTAWDTTTGMCAAPCTASVVAIIDTGVSATHPDFGTKLLTGLNALTAPTCTTASGVTDDDNGHGTHVAGIAAAIGNNGIGIAGISWVSPILPIKVLNSSGSGTTAQVACGLNFAASFAVATATDRVVANLSLGGPGYSQLLKDAVDLAINDNVVVVAASGNDGKATVLFPAGYPGVMAVGATDPTNARATFSTYGPQLSVVAPGVDIYSTLPTSGSFSSPTGFGFESGTSMATPHVAGVAALVRAANPGFTVSQVRSKIEQTATNLPTSGGGFNPQFGWGLVNAGAAIGTTVTNTYGGVQVTVSLSIASPGTVTLTPSTTGGTLGAATYFVKVTALEPMGRETAPSPESAAIVTGTTGSIAASWTAVPGAASYRVYMGTASGGENTYFTTTSPTFTITTNPGPNVGIPPTAPTAAVDVIIWAGTSACSGLTQVVRTTQTNSTGVATFSEVPVGSYCATASTAPPPAKGGTTSPFTVAAGATISVPVTIM